MKQKLLKRLSTFLKENEMLGTPATDEQIEQAEKELGIKFSADYIDFIKHFGGAYAGLSIHAFINGKAIGKETVIELTNALRISHPEVSNTYVISDDGSGNPIMINSKGEVLIYYHDDEESEVLASSLEKYIEENFEEW